MLATDIIEQLMNNSSHSPGKWTLMASPFMAVTVQGQRCNSLLTITVYKKSLNPDSQGYIAQAPSK